MNKLGFCIVFAILLIGIGYLFAFPMCNADITNNHTFVVDRPYREVIRVMGKPDTLEQIIAMQNGRVIEKKWDNLVFDLEKIIQPRWQVNGQGRFTIEVDDPDKGHYYITLYQQVHIDQQIMQIKTTSLKPSGGVQLVDNYMEVRPDGDKTRFTLTNRLVVQYRIPQHYHDYMKAKVNQANLSGIEATEKCVQNMCVKRGIISIPLQRFYNH